MQSDENYAKMIIELVELANKWNETVSTYNGNDAFSIIAHVSPYTGLIEGFSTGRDLNMEK